MSLEPILDASRINNKRSPWLSDSTVNWDSLSILIVISDNLKKGKVYTNPFHGTTACRKGRDHSIEILDRASRSNHLFHKSVDPMQIHGLNFLQL